MAATAPENTAPAVEAPVEAPVSADPFAAQREDGQDPFEKGVGEPLAAVSNGDADKLDAAPLSPVSPGEKKVRRTSNEWDASKVPPSQFQKRKGSIYATPSSRDHHSGDTERDKAYHEKLKEKTAPKSWNIFGSKKKQQPEAEQK